MNTLTNITTIIIGIIIIITTIIIIMIIMIIIIIIIITIGIIIIITIIIIINRIASWQGRDLGTRARHRLEGPRPCACRPGQFFTLWLQNFGGLRGFGGLGV